MTPGHSILVSSAVYVLLKSWQGGLSFGHGHDYKSNLFGLFTKTRIFAFVLVTTLHGVVQKTWKTPLYYAIDRWCLKRYEQVIAVSQDLYDEARRRAVSEERLHLIHNAIVTSNIVGTMTVAEAKSRIGWPEERLMVEALADCRKKRVFIAR